MPSSLPARIRLFLLCLLLACTALPSAATVLIDTCPTDPQQWVCFAVIEVQGPRSTTRVLNYKNREMLVEVEQPGKIWRRITTQKGTVVDHPVESDGTRHFPPMFLSQALGPIFMTLPLAYPDGPGSVPDEPVTRTIRIDRNNTATVSTSRGVDREIHFDISIVGDDIAPVKGSYHAGSLPSLPGDFDLRGWYREPVPGRPGQTPRMPEPAPERLELLR